MTDLTSYIVEIVCGLEHLPSMEIVHLEHSESNIPPNDSGYLAISGFGCGADFSITSEFVDLDCQLTLLIPAPEIINRFGITAMINIWN